MYIPMIEVTAGGGGGGRVPVPRSGTSAESALEITIQAWFDFYHNESCLDLS